MDAAIMKKCANNSGISAFFELKTIEVHPINLLLDPRNPRLAIESDEYRSFSEQDLAEADLQREILNQIEKKEHHVGDLIDSIREKGFMQGMGSFIVKRVPSTDKYMVIEGNRRTAAIKHLEMNPILLSAVTRKSIETLSVSEFQYRPNNTFTEEQIIDMLLGIIHLKGPLPWGAIEKARYVYHAYMREYLTQYPKNSFSFNSETIRRVCSIFPLDKADVKSSLRIYRVYEQLKDAGYKIKPDRYSLIEMAVNNTTLRDYFFEFDVDSFELSQPGLEAFYLLCIADHRPINDPATFRKFTKIVKIGGQTLVDDIISGYKTVDEVYDSSVTDIKQIELADQLDSILNKLKNLNISAFSEEDEDSLRIAHEIIQVVTSKLGAILVNSSFSCPNNSNGSVRPVNIQEAIRLPSDALKDAIRAALQDRPHQTCIKDKLVTYVLDHMEIVSRGEPRRIFQNKVDATLAEMIAEGRIKEYMATNERLKLLY